MTDASRAGRAPDIDEMPVSPRVQPPTVARFQPATQGYIAMGVVGFAVASIGGSIVLAARDVGADESQLGWLASAFGIGLVAVGAAGTRLLRRGPQPMVRAGAVLLAAGAALLAVAPNVVTAVIGGLVSGLGAAAASCSPRRSCSAVPTPRPDTAAPNAVSSAAGVLAPATLGAVDLTGVTGRTALLLPVIPLALLAQSARSGTADRTAAAVLDHVAATRVGAGAVGLGRRWAAIVLGVAVEFCFVVWGVGRLRETGISAGAAAILASAFPIGLVVGRVAVPGLIRRGRPPIIVGALVTAVATVTLVAVNSPAAATAALVVAGLGVAPF